MISDLDILQAVQKKLKENYPYPVYLQEVKEGFQTPAFFLKTLTVSVPFREKYVSRDTDIYITYLPEKQKASSAIYNTLFHAGRLFRDGIAVKDRFLSVAAMTEELIGQDNDGGRLTVSVQYYDADKQNEPAEIMEVLHQRRL